MTSAAGLADRLAQALPGARLAKLDALHGGDLSEVLRADLADGRRVVLKSGPLVEREARMLQVLAKAGAAVPDILGVIPSLLVMEWLPRSPATPNAWSRCGASLRAAHTRHGTTYGWTEEYAFGSVPIANAPWPDWPGFWSGRRLLPLASGLPEDLHRRLIALTVRLPDLLPLQPAPSLLHGDLWSGNVHFSGGRGVLIDPACYFGHGEVDLAMLDLFGGLPEAFLDGYGPPEPGFAARLPIYQLWPALVHLHLFGTGYLGMVARLLARIG